MSEQKKNQGPFTCRGCGAKKTPDGNPKNAAFVWTNEKTKKRKSYCYECDDKLIQDVPLPKGMVSWRIGDLIDRQIKTSSNCLGRVENEFSATGRIDGASLIMFCGGLFQIVQNLQNEIEALKEGK